MATKFYNVEKAAEILGVPAAEVNQLRETHQLRGLRDGADWKFKAEEVEALALKMKGAGSGIGSGSGIGDDLQIDEDFDVLLGDAEPGADPSASGTVIGPPPAADPAEVDPVDSAVAGFEDLDLSIDTSGLELASSGIELAGDDSGIDLDLDDSVKVEDEGSGGHESTGASSILGLADEELEGDDLVLGGESGIGSGRGSDITLGGESGISLLDPADSGISLEEPLDLSGSDSGIGSGSGGSPVLEGDSLLSLTDDDSVAESSSDLSSEGDDFMLSSLDDEEEDDDSQVIALEEEGAGSGIGDSLLDLGGGSSADISELGSELNIGGGDEEEIVDLSEGLGSGSGLGSSGSLGSGTIDFEDVDSGGFETFGEASEVQEAAPTEDFAAATPAVSSAAVAVSSEMGYTKFDYFFLFSSFFTLGLVGVLMYDLVRNVWIWDHAAGVNSWLIQMIFG